MENSDKEEIPCIYDEEPLHFERHPKNYLSLLGDVFSKYRRSLPRELRGAANFGEKILGRYYGHTVHRERIRKAEKGDPTVAFGVVAAYLNEMGALPDIIKAIDTGNTGSFRYLSLLEQEIAPQIEDAINLADINLRKKTEMELCRE